MITLNRPCVCLVTDRRRLAAGGRTIRDQLVVLEQQLDGAIEAGVDLIQLRERDLEAATLRDLARRVVARAGGRTRVLINDRADVAVAARAHGVHLRGDGPRIAEVRDLGPDSWVVGRSVHSVEGARSHSGADYLIFGTVFPTASKPAGSVIAGLDGLRSTASATPTPVLAIGGVTLGNVAACRSAGAAGVAAIGLFLSDPRGMVRAIRELWIANEPGHGST